MVKRIGLVVSALLGVGACSGPVEETPSWVDGVALTAQGELRGVVEEDVVRFKGVPYAAPPVGEGRFAPPEEPVAWEGSREAKSSGSACPQPGGFGAKPVTTEDCLLLDVTTPRAPGPPKPVMVWLHGGGFHQGKAADYDPARLAAEGDVVVVTVGFRLGILGYLAAPGLEGGGTFGMADQQQALRYLRENAAAFGGDPRRITLFGESGGATATCYHLTSPTARGLFDRAILQSAVNCGAPSPANAFGPSLRMPSPTRAEVELPAVERRGAALVADLGCDDVACLRDLPVERLLEHHLEFATPAVGGPLLPRHPQDALDEVTTPLLTGFTRDESRYFVASAALQGQPMDDGSYEDLIRDSFGDRADAVLAEYPREAHPDGRHAWAAVYTDRTFACPQLLANSRFRGPVHTYVFADRTAPPPIPLLPGTIPSGAAHAAELPYLFDMTSQPLDIEGRKVALTPAQRDLAGRMVEAWAEFARGGDAGAPRWDPAAPAALVFGGETADPWAEHRCGFWQRELR